VPRLSLVARAPVRVVDGGVLDQCREDENETHNQVDVDRFDVGNSRQRRAHRRTDGRHGEYRRYSYIIIIIIIISVNFHRIDTNIVYFGHTAGSAVGLTTLPGVAVYVF